MFCKYFPPVYGLSFHSFDSVGKKFSKAEILISLNSSLSILSLEIVPLVLYLKSYGQIQGHLDFLLCYLLGVLFIDLKGRERD